MTKDSCSGILVALTTITLAAFCQPRALAQTPAADAYFKTTFQTESQFIVESIVADLAEQIYYAANHQLPDKKDFSVAAKEKPGSPADAPAYDLQISLDAKHTGLKIEVNMNGPIWSPTIYRDAAAALAKAAGLAAGSNGKTGGTMLMARLMDGTAETIERQNQALSDDLEKDFSNPELHEEAALLLGAFSLREYSGDFSDYRPALSRMTAHLTIARYLRGADAFGINGQMAETIMLTLANDQALALEKLKSIGTNIAAVAGMVRALQAVNTGDFRPLAGLAGRSRVESLAWFAEMASYADTPSAWRKLSDEQRQTVDFERAANQMGPSVEMGNELMEESIPNELQEIGNVYELSGHKKLSGRALVTALNELPERCFTVGEGGRETHVRIIGSGQWAAFFQRELCHAVQHGFHFLSHSLGDPDGAKEFAAMCDEQFAGLRLYPFVQRFNCLTAEDYHTSEDAGVGVTVAAPQIVSEECWNLLSSKVSFAPLYQPSRNLHAQEWFQHNPPPGTAYNIDARLSLLNGGDHPAPVALFEQLHDLAPYDTHLLYQLVAKKYNNHATIEEAMPYYQALLPYSIGALRAVANTVSNTPDLYDKYMLQAAALNPQFYYDLGNEAIRQKQNDKAAQYFEQASTNDPDSVRISNFAVWRVRYYLRQGQTDKARAIADFGAMVYSYQGLESKANFMEATSNYNSAYEWFAKIDERYDDSAPLVAFCLRYWQLTNDTRFEKDLQKRVQAVFPIGLEHVRLGDFKAAPTDGVKIQIPNNRLASGFRRGDVIVAIEGVRVHTVRQYIYVRDLPKETVRDIIIWQDGGYHEVNANTPKSNGAGYANFKSGGAPVDEP
jgi:tetratricopeptide (TPR) repeat protein